MSYSVRRKSKVVVTSSTLAANRIFTHSSRQSFVILVMSFIRKDDVLMFIRMFTRNAVTDHKNDAWNFAKDDIDSMMSRCKGDQEIKRWRWGREQAFEACLKRIRNRFDNRRENELVDDALVLSNKITEEEYQYEMIFIPMINRIRIIKLTENKYESEYINGWADDCIQQRKKFDFDWWLGEIQLNEFFEP